VFISVGTLVIIALIVLVVLFMRTHTPAIAERQPAVDPPAGAPPRQMTH
jgi:hypothetical protein